jgi:hypothetical protein
MALLRRSIVAPETKREVDDDSDADDDRDERGPKRTRSCILRERRPLPRAAAVLLTI